MVSLLWNVKCVERLYHAVDLGLLQEDGSVGHSKQSLVVYLAFVERFKKVGRG